MSYVVRMPKLGVEMETGIVIEWYLDVGETAEEGDVIAEIESEKSTAEVAAREDGALRERYLDAGEEGPPGAAMGIFAPPDADISSLRAEIDVEPDEAAADADEDAESATGEATTDDGGAPESVEEPAQPAVDDGTVRASPRAKRRAEELGVTLSRVEGTGPEGGIVADDVAAAAGDAGGRTIREERTFSGMRSTIADRLSTSYREAAHVTVDREVEVEAAFAAAEAAGEDASLTDVLLLAVSATLDEHPEFNATFDAETETHTLYEEHNIGVAVDLDGGLVTPVIPDVGGKSIGELARQRSRLTDRVLDGEYDADDLSGGTFTVSNLGVVGSDSFTPIINPPEIAILGVNRVRERPVNTDSGIEFPRHITFSLSFDHRVVDGADAARFLVTLDETLAAAEKLLD